MDLNIIWFFLVGVLIVGYSILDGFDLGVGVIHLFTKIEDDRIGKMEEIANQRIKAANAKKSIGKGIEKESSKSEGMLSAEEANKLGKKNS